MSTVFNNPQIAVIGLGAFGLALVKALVRENAKVMAIDNTMEHLDEVKDILSNAICFDATDPNLLKNHGVTQVDIAVISIGKHFEPVVMIAMELINSGVKKIYARANNPTQETILKKIGVHEIIYPEREVAERLGVTLHRQGLEDLLELGEGLSIVEVDAPAALIGLTLEHIQFRKRYGINVLVIKRMTQVGDSQNYEYRSIGVPDGSTKLRIGDKLVILGERAEVDKMIQLNN